MMSNKIEKYEMRDKIKERLGANYCNNTEFIIDDIIEDMTLIACDASSRKENDIEKKLRNDLIPVRLLK